MSHFSRRSLVQLTAGAALLPAAGLLRSAQAAEMVATDAFTYMASQPEFTTWIQLIGAGGLEASARSSNPFTVFPPTNDAFASAGNEVKNLLAPLMAMGSRANVAFADTSLIVKLVRSHVVLGKHLPSEANGGVMTATTLAGTPVSVDTGKKPVTVTWTSVLTGKTLTANLVETPIITLNAVIYPVDSIFMG